MGKARVIFQADYEVLSSQFAGLVFAIRHGTFAKAGIDVVLRGRVRPGSEADVVVAVQETAKILSPPSAPLTLALGCAEQNIVVPAQANGAAVKAVSAMLQKSPLGLGLRPSSNITSLKELADPKYKVGMLADSITLAQAMLRTAAGGSASAGLPEVKEVTNGNKIGLLLHGKLDAIQIYDATEPVEIKLETGGQEPKFLPLGDQMGYGQVIFGHGPTLAKSHAHQHLLTSFLEGLYEGWAMAFEDPKAAAKVIIDERRKAGVVDNPRVETVEYQEECIKNFQPYVAPDESNKLGTIDPARYAAANAFFLTAGILPQAVDTKASLDTHLWKRP